MKNENNNEPQLTPMNDNQNVEPQLTPMSDSQNTETKNPQIPNNGQVVSGEISKDIKTDNGARIDTETAGGPQIHTAAFETKTKEKKERTWTHDGPSGKLTAALVIFFIFLIAFVLFLPEISDVMRQFKEQRTVEEINSGKLICTYERSNDKLDFKYTRTFEFKDKAMFKFTNKEEVSGSTEDTKELTKINDQCSNLEKVAGSLKGIDISCQLLNTKQIRTEVFNYNEIGDNSTAVKTAYVEGGGTYPEFKLGENIDDVEVSVNQAGYTCEKIK